MSTPKNEGGLLQAAVIGNPVSQSLSPLMHGHWFESLSLEGRYQAVEVQPDDLRSVMERFQSEGYDGFNVTVPYKTAIVPLLDKLTPLAREMGAVNTVKFNPNGTATGINTDGIGFLKHLKDTAPQRPTDKPVVILGAGGAARAAALALLNDGASMIMISNRTRAKAEAVATEVGRGRIMVVDWEERSTAAGAAGLIVNTTALGMVGQPTLEIDLNGAASDTVVYDIVYKPLNTLLLKAANKRGLKTVDGLGMLVHQGAAAFKLWFGHDVGYDDALRQKLLAVLGEDRDGS